MLAQLKLKRSSIYEGPPARPVGIALKGDSYHLWKYAMDQFQSEGTHLFDAVRPSLDISGPHEGQ